MNKLLKIAVFAAAAMIASPVAAGEVSLLKTVEYQTNSLDALPQWRNTLAKIAHEQKSCQACAKSASACGSRAMEAWRGMIKQQRSLSDPRRSLIGPVSCETRLAGERSSPTQCGGHAT